MAMLSKKAIQRLALLRTLSVWPKGADGPALIHRALFAAEKLAKNRQWRLFGFKQGRFAEYSDEVASALNDLQRAGRIETIYDGPSARIRAKVPTALRKRIDRFFDDYFPEWRKALLRESRKSARGDHALVRHARNGGTSEKDDRTQPIFCSFRSSAVEFKDLDADVAEQLSDFADTKLQGVLRQRIVLAAKRPRRDENWRQIYFGKAREPA